MLCNTIYLDHCIFYCTRHISINYLMKTKAIELFDKTLGSMSS